MSISIQVDAKKEPVAAAALAEKFPEVTRVVATKGKSVRELKLLPGEMGSEECLALVVGPSGNLRAPAFLIGKTLLVGFDEGAYSKIFR